MSGKAFIYVGFLEVSEMKRYKRLTTTQVVNGRSIKTVTNKVKVTIQDLIDRLYELEDKIENGTLVEFPCKEKENEN